MYGTLKQSFARKITATKVQKTSSVLRKSNKNIVILKLAQNSSHCGSSAKKNENNAVPLGQRKKKTVFGTLVKLKK